VSKKINSKKKPASKKPTSKKPLKKKLKWKGEPATSSNSVPWKDIPDDVKKELDPTYGSAATLIDDPKELAKEADPEYKGFKKEDFEAALRSTGQMTDAEVVANKHKLPMFDIDKFAEKVDADEIPVEDMIAWVACLLSNSSSKNSFEQITEKMFYFRLNQMTLSQLIVLKHRIDQNILEKVMPKKDICPGDQATIDDFKVG
jgi:hypothetical protein